MTIQIKGQLQSLGQPSTGGGESMDAMKSSYKICYDQVRTVLDR